MAHFPQDLLRLTLLSDLHHIAAVTMAGAAVEAVEIGIEVVDEVFMMTVTDMVRALGLALKRGAIEKEMTVIATAGFSTLTCALVILGMTVI